MSEMVQKKSNPYGTVKFKSVDEYHSNFSVDVRQKLDQLRRAIKNAAPESEEVISYNMPAFKLNKVLVYYAASKKHIGFYPTPAPIEVFKNDLTNYKTSKGAIQFPLDKTIPISLVKKIVKFRVIVDAEKRVR
jgi:uncharacterized protein YdhG (YjbR/CyaY superfamily)